MILIVLVVLFLASIVVVPIVISRNESAQAVGGDEFVWTGAGDGVSWTDADNWEGAVSYPDSSTQTAIFSATASAVTLPTTEGFEIGTLQTTGDFTGSITMMADLTLGGFVSGGGTFDTNGYNLTLNGSLTLAGNTDCADGMASSILFGSGSHSISGNVSNAAIGASSYGCLNLGSSTIEVNGDFDMTDNYIIGTDTSTVSFVGAAMQTFICNSQDFNKLSVSNSSTDGVYLADNCSAQTFQDVAGGSIVSFNDSSTFAFDSLILTGDGGDNVVLQSYTAGRPWYLNVSAATVNNVTVSDSDASGGSAIDASNGTNTDAGNNINWYFTSSPTTSTTSAYSGTNTTADGKTSYTTTDTTAITSTTASVTDESIGVTENTSAVSTTGYTKTYTASATAAVLGAAQESSRQNNFWTLLSLDFWWFWFLIFIILAVLILAIYFKVRRNMKKLDRKKHSHNPKNDSGDRKV